jgi:CheY-specific phosphatase CheX
MSQTIQITSVREYLAHHLTDVFSTMLSMKAVLLASTEAPPFNDRVSGSVGFGGETVTGAVYLHLSASLANQLTAGMLSLPPAETPSEADVNDVVGEMTNMLTGGLKSWLCNCGAECAVSTPAIIRGTAFVIESLPDVARDWLVFECGEERFMVEFHIKFN